jgi:hypothetical protein
VTVAKILLNSGRKSNGRRLFRRFRRRPEDGTIRRSIAQDADRLQHRVRQNGDRARAAALLFVRRVGRYFLVGDAAALLS